MRTWMLACIAALAACGDDGGTTGDASTGSSTGEGSMSGSPSTSTSTTSSTTSSSSSSSSSSGTSTTDAESSSSTTETTVATEPTSSSSGELTSSSSSSSTGGEAAGYGDCLNNPADEVCLREEECNLFGNANQCAQQECDAPDECPSPASGTAEPACFDWGLGPFCGLDCSAGDTCPDGMDCFLGMWCSFLIVSPGGGICPDEVLDVSLPVTFDGDTTGLADDHTVIFGGFAERTDALLEFTAPESQLYDIDATSADFTPYIFALEGCGGTEFAGATVSAGLHMTLSLDAGQTIVIGVEAQEEGVEGTYTLTIDAAGPQLGGSECCAYQPGVIGCSVQEVEDCVCADPWCCDTEWDGVCGLRAGECGADCI